MFTCEETAAQWEDSAVTDIDPGSRTGPLLQLLKLLHINNSDSPETCKHLLKNANASNFPKEE